MYVLACKLYEDEGRPLPRHRLNVLRPEESASRGWLVYRESYDSNHKRTMMKAQLLGEDGQGHVFPELLDAVMMIAENSVMTIRGNERDPITRKLTGMAWWCKVIGLGRRGHQHDPDGPTLV
jgi:hypothetical protein